MNPAVSQHVPAKLRWGVFLAVALLGLVVRLPQLSERPMHTDEAVNGYITGQLLAGEGYEYDPEDRHGPVLYLAAIPIARSAGAESLADLDERTVRLVPVVFSLLTLLVIAGMASRLGFVAGVASALLMTVDPLAVYYSRYFVHESLFVAGTAALMLAGFRALENKSAAAAVATGACAAFILGCKETALIQFAAFVPAVAWWAWVRRSDLTRRSARWRALIKPALWTVITFAAVVVGLYTWGGQNWQGPMDLLRSIPRFAARAGGEGHEKPFWYYAELLGGGGMGWAILGLSAIAAVKALRRVVKKAGIANPVIEPADELALQMLALYTIAICVIHSVIPYKNPWLALNLWFPLALLAGVGFQWLWRRTHKPAARGVLILVFAGILAFSAKDTWQWCFQKSSDERNPYAYAHTVEDLLGLPARVQEAMAGLPEGEESTVAVIAEDPWPLPWYLRRFGKVGYHQPGGEAPPADLYITSLEAAASLETTLAGWRPEFFGVRPEVLILLWTPPGGQAAHD